MADLLDPPLNTNELAEALGIHPDTLTRLKKTDAVFVKKFEVTHPVGQRRYSRALVERYLAGLSIVPFGAGSRKLRRAS